MNRVLKMRMMQDGERREHWPQEHHVPEPASLDRPRDGYAGASPVKPYAHHESEPYRDRRHADAKAMLYADDQGDRAEAAEPFDRRTAEEWVHSMRNSDPAHPTGGRWTMDELKPLAQKYGIPTDGEAYYEFYAMTNAMYSDYAEVAKKFGISSPEFYACMAKAWLKDKDAMDGKTALYYRYIVKK